MRSSTPTLHCDGPTEDDPDGCRSGHWDVDYYEATASTVDGVSITATERAPGWKSTDDYDRCPDCQLKAAESVPGEVRR